jgi:hypothetical protein
MTSVPRLASELVAADGIESDEELRRRLEGATRFVAT